MWIIRQDGLPLGVRSEVQALIGSKDAWHHVVVVPVKSNWREFKRDVFKLALGGDLLSLAGAFGLVSLVW